MKLSKRERNIFIAMVVVVSAAGLNYLVLRPYLDWRSQLVERSNARAGELDEAHRTLRKAADLRRLLIDMGTSIKSDPSAAEAQLMHLIHDWEQQCAMGDASFQRLRTADEHGFTRLTYHLSATGAMPAVAMLLYHVETAPIPLSIDDVQVTPKPNTADELQVYLSVSTLCRRTDTKAMETHADVAMTGDPR